MFVVIEEKRNERKKAERNLCNKNKTNKDKQNSRDINLLINEESCQF